MMKSEKTPSPSLLVTNDFPPIVSGISTVFYQLFKLQKEERFFILAPRVEGCEEFDAQVKLPVIRVKLPVGESQISKVIKTVLNFLYIVYYVQKLKIKKIHCGQILSNGLAGFFCKRIFNIPYIVWVYGSETIRFGDKKYLAFLIKKILSSAKLIIANSNFTKQEYYRFGVGKNKIFIITPGVDTQVFRPTEKQKKLIQKYHLKGKFVLLTIARLDERKGHDAVIKALNILKKEYPKIIYLIVGKGREEEKLQRLVRTYCLENEVLFAGYVSDEDLPSYYNLGDLFILPNRKTENSALKGDYEGFGIVFIEASACGKAVIGGSFGGVSDAVKAGETGILVNGQSSDQIVSAIKTLVSDTKKRNQMGATGRLRAEREFDWKILSRKLEKIL